MTPMPSCSAGVTDRSLGFGKIESRSSRMTNSENPAQSDHGGPCLVRASHRMPYGPAYQSRAPRMRLVVLEQAERADDGGTAAIAAVLRERRDRACCSCWAARDVAGDSVRLGVLRHCARSFWMPFVRRLTSV